MALTKVDIVKMLNKHLGIPQKESISLVENVFDIIKDELDQGNDVKISGFGKWKVKDKRERRGRNPQTGKEMMIDARKIVTFKPSPILKATIND
jgi:integration host factor subunit alpha